MGGSGTGSLKARGLRGNERWRGGRAGGVVEIKKCGKKWKAAEKQLSRISQLFPLI